MPHVIQFGRELAAAAFRVWGSPMNLSKYAAVAIVLIVWLVAKRRLNRRWKPAAPRDLAADGFWTLFYLGGVYSICIATPLFVLITTGIHRFAPWLELSLLAGAPAIVQVLTFSLVMDFAAYWWHRWAHTSSILWKMHRVHHSDEELNPLTNFRVHFGDMLIRGLVQVIPSVILSPSAGYFFIAILLETFFNAMAHADVGWSYGPAGRLLVSPQFHRIHHGNESRWADRNFGLTYSLWDYIFGTAVTTSEQPASYGLAEAVPRSFFVQLLEPFIAMIRRRGPRPAAIDPGGDISLT
jgi:sterol desaturase/sphingolipid hydroxylase (fatty acid hydroxylase superfamily)